MTRKFYYSCLPALSLLIFPMAANAQYTATSLLPTASLPLLQIQADYALSSAQIVSSITMSTQQVVGASASGTGHVIKALVSSSSKASNDSAQMKGNQAKLAMDFNAELAAKKIRAQSTIISPDDSSEEVDRIRKFLLTEGVKDKSLTEIIAYAKAELDGKPIPIVSETNKGKCTPAECGIMTVINPSKKIARYAEMCAVNKRNNVDKNETEKSKVSTRSESASKTQTFIESSNSELVLAKRVAEQQVISCTPEAKSMGVCGGDVTEDEYTEKLLANEIIPNGAVSSSNFYQPTSVGGQGYLDLSDPKIESLVSLTEYESLNRDDVKGGADLPPISDTYRNSSQLKAASGFVDNLISADIVHNQSSEERTSSSSSSFQAMFLSRQASLSLARSSFDDSLSSRRGTVMTGVDILDPELEFIKEREDGASSVDRLRYEIDKNMDMFSGKNMEKVAAMDERALVGEQLKQLTLSNKMGFGELIRLEKLELLVATMLAQEINSPENIENIKSGGK